MRRLKLEKKANSIKAGNMNLHLHHSYLITTVIFEKGLGIVFKQDKLLNETCFYSQPYGRY